MRRKRKHNKRKHLQRKDILDQLIKEQKKELKIENKSVHFKGNTNSFKKGRNGIFVGNKVF